MQSTEQVDKIVQTKIQSIKNKKVIDDMQSALKEIDQEKKANSRYATIGLALSILIIIYLVITFFY
jgi:hypothetical protein